MVVRPVEPSHSYPFCSACCSVLLKSVFYIQIEKRNLYYTGGPVSSINSIIYIRATGKMVMKTGGSDMCNTNGAEYTLRRLGIRSLKERRCCHGKLEALVGAFSYSEGHHALKHGVVVTDGTSVASGCRHREMQHRAALCQPARGEVDPGSDLGSSTSQLRTVKVRRRKQEVTATYTTAISKLLDQLVKLPVICRPIYAPQQHHRGLSLIDPCLDIEC